MSEAANKEIEGSAAGGQPQKNSPNLASGHVASPPNSEPAPATKNMAENQNPPPESIKDKIKWWIELLAFVLGLGLFVLTYLQFNEMKETRIMSERAWLGFDNSGLQLPYTNSHICIRTQIKNTGHTPAYIDRVVVEIKSQSHNATNIIVSKVLPGAVVGPDKAHHLIIREPPGLSEEAFSLLVQERVMHVFYISVYYRDVFGKSRLTRDAIIVTGKQDNPSSSGAIFRLLEGFGRMD